MPTVPELFSMASGRQCVGPHRCFYCGAPADETIPASEHVGEGFTARDTCACPHSPWVCVGCDLVHRSVPMPGYALPQRAREHSWLVTPTAATPYITALTVAVPDRLKEAGDAKLAYRREQLACVRKLCLEPPEPPYALVLTVGGRTHQLYRGVVCHSREEVSLTLELERIRYRPADLRERVQLCKRLIAATGKPRLGKPPDTGLLCALQEYCEPGEPVVLLEEWERIWNAALTRLAVFLAPVKEDCAREYPAYTDPAAADAPGVRRRRQATRRS